MPRTTWGSIILGGIVALIILAAVGGLLRGIVGRAGSPPDCDALVPQIMRLSEARLLSILKISNVTTTSATDTRVQCRGDARWSNNWHAVVSFHWERDADGDAFIGYRMQP